LLSGQQRITVANIEMKRQFQRAGLGVGFLPKVLVAQDLQDGTLVAVTLEEPRQPEPLWLATRSGDNGEAANWWYKTLNRPLL
jgi:DNA-binding transcriptional LysR family regulator